MGERNEEVTNRVLAMFTDTVTVLQAELLGLQLAIGAGLGTLAGFWLYLLLKILRRDLGRRRFVAATAALLLLVHLFVLWYGMTRYPQLFVDEFYNAGPLLHAFQVVPSEWLPLWFYQLLASLALLSFPGMGIGLLARTRRARPASLPRAAVLPITLLAVSLVAAAGLMLPIWHLLPDAWRFSIPAPASKPDVLLLVADSLRPDYMEPSRGTGYRRIAQRAVIYEDAWTIMARTFPAWVSMLDGQYPTTHGVRNMFPTPQVLARHYPTLPRILSEAGYDTGVFSDFAGDIFGRIDLGFRDVDVPEFSLRSNVRLGCWKMHIHLLPYLAAAGWLDNVEDFRAYERYADPESLTDRFLDWLGRREPDRPYLGVLFYSASHSPYAAGYPYYRDRRAEGYSGPHRFCKFGQGGARRTTPEDEEQVRQDFQAGVDAVDDQVARLLDRLDQAGRLDNTLVVLTADHGENLWEHDRGNSHGDMLAGRESLVVPYMFMTPGRTEPLRIPERVSNVTLAPTILGLLEMPVPEWMEGENLAANPDFRPRSQAPVYSETGLLFVDPETDVLRGRSIRYSAMFDMFEFTPETYILYLAPKYYEDSIVAKHRMFAEGRHKLIYIPTRQGARFECYDLEADPEEIRNIYSPDHPECGSLKERLLTFMVNAGDGQRVKDLIVPD